MCDFTRVRTDLQTLNRQKLDQASELLLSTDIDAWITFVRETSGGGDPVLPLILEGGLTWQSALIVTRAGRKIAVVGNYDADPLIAAGNWDAVVPYVQDIEPALRETLLQEVDHRPVRVGVNYSPDDVMADGLTHGMYLLLREYLAGEEFDILSAAPLVLRLRAQKTDEELRRMTSAIRETEAIFARMREWAKIGVSERTVYNEIQSLIDSRGFGYSWARVGNPIVNSGPDSMIGHGIPSSTIMIEPGHVFHIDLGLIVEGYASDIQRCWYVPHPDESSAPGDVVQGLQAVVASIDAAAQVLRPGVPGWEVDAAARTEIQRWGYPEYMHAVGHQVGRMAHDGGTILGPRWARYGKTPDMQVEPREVYTLELGVTLPGRGYIGIEEMVLVSEAGCQFLTERQTSMPLL